MKIIRWLPAVLMMVVIFVFSSITGRQMPSFGPWDLIVKKGAHVLGYALLASSLWYAQGFDKHRAWLSLVLAVLYAISDEFHQSFVAGRQPSWVDALVIDGCGAAFGLFAGWLVRKKREQDIPAHIR